MRGALLGSVLLLACLELACAEGVVVRKEYQVTVVGALLANGAHTVVGALTRQRWARDR